jgi:molybdopterin molybdotransferase
VNHHHHHNDLRPSLEQHAAHVRALVAPAIRARTSGLAPESVPLGDALGRVTASVVLSAVDLPLFRNSQMDGFAVRSADVANTPVSLPIVGTIAAAPGAPAPLAAGTAVRIMTGGVVPHGADAVVPVEDTTTAGNTVTISRGRTRGEFVRDRGSDARTGDELLPAGRRLESRHLAALAAAGLARVDVIPLVRVAVITTGAELIAPGSSPAPGQLFDANQIALVAAVRAAGGTVSVAVRVTDDSEAMREALAGAAAASDLIVTSGGISMGEFEVVRETLEPLGAIVGHIDLQPGGPQATAMLDGVAVVCFPGNPVSTQLSFEAFVAPLLREAAGLPAAGRAALTLTADLHSIEGRRQLVRARRLEGERVEPVAGPGSHLVVGLAASDVLIDVASATTELKAGDIVTVWQL